MNDQEYFAEQARIRLADLGIKTGPRQPLEEMRAEIERLLARIAQLETVAAAARAYLVNSTAVNALKLDDALNQAKGEKQG